MLPGNTTVQREGPKTVAGQSRLESIFFQQQYTFEANITPFRLLHVSKMPSLERYRPFITQTQAC